MQPYIHMLLSITLWVGCHCSSIAQSQGSNPFDIKSSNSQKTSHAAAQPADNPFDVQAKPLIDSTAAPAAALPPAKQAANPFELSGDAKAAASPPETKPPLSHQNPFDKQRKSLSGPAPKAEKEIHEPGRQRLAVTGTDSNFLFWTILTSLFLLTLLFTLFRPIIVKSYRAFTNDNFLKLIHRDQGAFISTPYLMLYIAFFINAAIFLLLLWRQFGWIEAGSFSLLLVFVGGVAGIFLLKHIMLMVVAYAFPVSKDVRQYSFMIVVFSIVLGLLLVPVNVLIAYGPEALVKAVVYATIGLIVAIYLFRIFRSLFLAGKYIGFHKFHFFMYLCTVEIAPALVLAKLLLMKAGIQ